MVSRVLGFFYKDDENSVFFSVGILGEYLNRKYKIVWCFFIL